MKDTDDDTYLTGDDRWSTDRRKARRWPAREAAELWFLNDIPIADTEFRLVLVRTADDLKAERVEMRSALVRFGRAYDACLHGKCDNGELRKSQEAIRDLAMRLHKDSR